MYYKIEKNRLMQNPMNKVINYNRSGVLSLVITLIMFSCKPSSPGQNIVEAETPERHYKFLVLYPQPTDTIQFDLDYSRHLALLDSLMGYAEQDKPYYITKLDQEVFGSPSPFYQMFTLGFETREELDTTINSTEMQEAGKDAMRISSGGTPVVLIGND